jgi:hypothetical protein
MNEPDSMGIKLEPSSGHPGARELYLETLDALLSMVPDGLLYILEDKHSCKIAPITDAMLARCIHLGSSWTVTVPAAQRQHHASATHQAAALTSSTPRLCCCRC